MVVQARTGALLVGSDFLFNSRIEQVTALAARYAIPTMYSLRDYRDIAMLFNQARKRLAFAGCMYVLFSTDSDLDLLGNLIRRADFAARLVAEQSIFIESLIIYELRVR